MLKLGILGLGEGRSTMSAALNSKKWHLKTICDLNIDLCKQRSKEFDFAHYTTDFNDKLRYYFRFEGKSHHAGEYQNYLEYFADCLESGQTAYPDLKEGIGTIAVLKTMEQSLKTGLPVKTKDTIL